MDKLVWSGKAQQLDWKLKRVVRLRRWQLDWMGGGWWQARPREWNWMEMHKNKQTLEWCVCKRSNVQMARGFGELVKAGCNWAAGSQRSHQSSDRAFQRLACSRGSSPRFSALLARRCARSAFALRHLILIAFLIWSIKTFGVGTTHPMAEFHILNHFPVVHSCKGFNELIIHFMQTWIRDGAPCENLIEQNPIGPNIRFTRETALGGRLRCSPWKCWNI